MVDGSRLPRGTVTFVFSDIEGSTRLYQELGDTFIGVLEEHNRRLRGAIGAHRGVEVRTEGDALFVAFADAADAVAACLDAQLALAVNSGWPHSRVVKVRMGMHTGPVNVIEDDYVGLAVHEAARIAAAAHGGQVLASEDTVAAASGRLPPDAGLRDLGPHALKDFPEARHLFQVTHPGLEVAFPPIRTLTARGHNLPTPAASFVGRADALARVQQLLVGETRLVSLVGSGGIGKSRLAIESGWSLLSWFPEGVWFVGLAEVSGPDGVLPAVCHALGVVETAGVSLEEALHQRLSAGPILLIVDNMEHLLDGAVVLADLLAVAPPLKILTTSRERLRLRGEHVVTVESLGLPAPGAAAAAVAEAGAVRLFVDRAAAQRADFALTEVTAPHLIKICELLDGVPLALELAAARIAEMDIAAVAAGLDDALDLLAEGERDLPSRQQTMRATVGWSYQMLKPPAQDLLQTLSVFAGGATIEAVEEVHGGGDVGALLDQLADASMLRRGGQRWWMLETIRQFAAEQLDLLGEAAGRFEAHARWVLGLAARAAPELVGPDQASWLEALEADRANLDAALDRADPRTRLAIAARLLRFWSTRGHWTQGRAHLARALAIDSDDVDVDVADRAEALMGAGHLATRQGDTDAAAAYLQEGACLAEANDLLTTGAMCHQQLAWLARVSGDAALADTELDRGLTLADQAGDNRTIALIRNDQAVGRVMRGDNAGAIDLLGESLAAYEKAGDLRSQTETISNMALAQAQLGDLASARASAGRASGLAAAVGDSRLGAKAAIVGATVDLMAGQTEAALLGGLQAVAIAKELGDTALLYGVVDRFITLAPATTATRTVVDEVIAWYRNSGFTEDADAVAAQHAAATAREPAAGEAAAR